MTSISPALQRDLDLQRRHARRETLSGWGVTALVSVLCLVIWQMAAQFGLSDLGVIASPTEIISEIMQNSSLYLRNARLTVTVALLGWLWGNLAAIVVAVLFVQVPVLESLFMRLAVTLFCLPLVAVNPILQLTFDLDTARVILAALAVFFTTLVGTMLGLRSADGNPMTMISAWGGGRLSALRYVRIPSGTPAILTGLQVGVPAAVLGAIFSEFIGAKSGLGVLLVNGLMSQNLPQVWSVAVIVTVVSVIPYVLLGWARRKMTPWSTSMSSSPPAPRSTAGSRGTRWTVGALWTLASLAVIIAAWYLYLAVFQVSPFVGKNAGDVVEYLFTSPDAAVQRSEVFTALGTTAVHAGVGYVTGLISGVVAATLFVTYPIVERVFTPVALALRSVPIIVLIPILILAFGRGMWGVVVITAIVTFFPTMANTQTGLQQVSDDGMTLMRSYNASVMTRLFRLQLPSSLPSIFASARIAAPNAILAATLAEWLATGDGLGHFIVISRSHTDYTGLWAAAAVLTCASLVFYALVSAAERLVLDRFSPGRTS
ncbi:ABC transporter permease [Corynebacterium neomassiliense]|uniref:ABC transporter permease n=1 Tax=Corynebacterium neomassiliense TaxID=2079482 RepID=UPI0010323B13|nr:ABC transporter permease subunit [Corynebacterium neomassiliense]